MAATIRDVAKVAGVSFKTVSNVINNYPHIRESTRERVLAAIEQLEFRPSHAAQSLARGRTGLIGFAVPEVSLPYFAALNSEVIEAAARRGIGVVTEQTNRNRDGEIGVLTSALRQMTDGLLFSPLSLRSEDLGVIEASGPLVLLGESVFTDRVDHVTMKNVDAARAATEYLIELGHRRIVIIGSHPGEPDGTPGLRLRGYRQALDSAGIRYDERLVGRAELWHRLEGAVAMRRILDEGADFDAVFAFNDTLAFGAMHTLQESGLRVPEDVSVIGFDDTDEGRYSLPTLTTVDPGRQRIAELAVETLLARMDQKGQPARRIEVQFKLVPRGSTSPRS